MARHPLQRLEAPSRQSSMTLHLLGIVSFSASFKFLSSWETPMSAAHGGNYQFLTIIGLTLAQITFVLALAADLTLSQRIYAVKNALATFSAPLEILITVLYWGLCAIDKSLVFPPDFQLDFLPDFGFHAAPGILLALDLLLFSPPWTIQAYSALALSSSLAFVYWFWIEYLYTLNGWYPYPILGILSVYQRVFLFSVSVGLMAGSTMLLKWLYGKINGIERFQKEAVTNPAGLRTKAE